jgi:hypothetical protein
MQWSAVTGVAQFKAISDDEARIDQQDLPVMLHMALAGFHGEAGS